MMTAERLTLFRRVAGWSLLLGLTAAILDYRCHGYFVNPDLRAEDGKMVYSFFYEHRYWQALLRFKAGYTPLVPNALGYIAARLPPPAAPYFLAMLPATFAVAVFVVFNAAAFRRCVPSDRIRLCCCLGLALAPLGTFFLVCNTDYSIWNLLVLLLWLVAVPLPARKSLAVLLSLLLLILLWSHPISIVALPATLCWLYFEKRHFSRALQALIACAQILHVFYGTRPQGASFLLDHHSVWERTWASLVKFYGLFMHALSSALFPHFDTSWPAISEVCVGALLLALIVCVALPKQPLASRAFFAWLLYCMVVPLLLIVFVRQSGITNPRYLYATRVFGIVALCVLSGQGLAFALDRLPRFRRVLWMVPQLAVLGYCLSLNRPGANAAYSQADPRNGQIIHDCLARLDRLQREHGSFCKLFVQCRKRQGDWPFTIDTRHSCD